MGFPHIFIVSSRRLHYYWASQLQISSGFVMTGFLFSQNRGFHEFPIIGGICSSLLSLSYEKISVN
jgi:hypothetical protein